MKNSIIELSNLEFCVFDLETTGGNHQKDGIIEIGIVIIKNRKIVKKKNYLINPEQRIPEFIQKLTSISDKDVESAPKINEVIDEILKLMGDRILVAHNTSFDVPFFNSVLTRLGKKELLNKSICTNLMTKYLIPNLLSTNLTYMSKMFSLDHGKAHRALDDAHASAQLLLKYLEIFEKKNIDKLNHLYYPRNKYELDRANFKNDLNNLSKIKDTLSEINSPFVCSIKGAKGILRYVFPLLPQPEQKDFILKVLNEMGNEWSTLSIQIYGSISEAFLSFNKYATKLKFEDKKYVISNILKIHGLTEQQHEEVISGLKKSPDQYIRETIGSFIITGHLVDEQFMIFSTQQLGPKNSLVFKFPAHQKKLQQFITSRSYKKATKRNIDFNLHSLIILLIKKYDERIVFTDEIQNQKKFPELISIIETRLSKYKYPYNYPQSYI